VKKEQEQQGLRLSAMYARALLGGCIAGGGAQGGHSGTACPSFGIPDFTVFCQHGGPNCSKPVDKASEKTTQTEAAELNTKFLAETVSNEAELVESSDEIRRKDGLECEICTQFSLEARLLSTSLSLDAPRPSSTQILAGTRYATVIIITRDLTFGDHAALWLANDGDPVLYDPQGGYLRGTTDAPGSDTAIFHDPETARLGRYTAHHRSEGSKVELYRFFTSAEESHQILERIEPSDGTKGIGEGNSPGVPSLWPNSMSCSIHVSEAIRGVGPFGDLPIYIFPGSLASHLERLMPQAQSSTSYWQFMLGRLTD